MAPSRSKSTPDSADRLVVRWSADEPRVIAALAVEAAPGDELLLPADVARSLVEQGYADLIDPDPVEG